MPGRKYNSPNYRYGFNGKEKDDEGEFGSITNYDYGFRIYNPAVGRFLSVDPLTREYPWYTPYQFAGNKPIKAVDLDGLEELDNELNSVAERYGITVQQIIDGGIDGVGNLITIAMELAVTDNFEGKLIRSLIDLQGIDLSNEITDQHLGAAFQIRKRDREFVLESQSSGASTLLDAGLSGLAASSILSPKGTTGLLAKTPATNLIATTLKKSLPPHVFEGIAFENTYFKKLIKEGRKVQRRVSFVTKFKNKSGVEEEVRAVVDFVEKTANGFRLIETKLKSTTALTTNQKKVYEAIKQGNAVPVGENATAIGLKTGKKFKGTVERVNKIEVEGN